MTDARLNELDQTEARDVALRLRPDWTEQDFVAAWERFVELKRMKGMQ